MTKNPDVSYVTILSKVFL